MGLTFHKKLSGTLSCLMTHSFQIYLLIDYQIQNTMLVTRDMTMNRSCPPEDYILMGQIRYEQPGTQ